ncbi:hypothetical protein [Clostridium baratii]|uniref:hypothetical protein n=1 Tax=Clostridium baratii TaxID=1561 RepID=UPI0030D0C845
MKEGFVFNCTDCGKRIRVNYGEVYSIYFRGEGIYKKFCKECALKSIYKEKR